MFVPLRFVLIKKLDALPFQLTEAQINCKKKKYILKIYSNRAKKKIKMKTCIQWRLKREGGKKLAYSLHGNRAVGLITVSTLVVIGRFSRERHSLFK